MSSTDAASPPSAVTTETVSGLPPSWSLATPQADDAPALHDLLARHATEVKGSPSTGLAEVDAVLTTDRDAYQHVVVRDDDGAVRAWATVHDRALGRVVVSVAVDPDLPRATSDPLAAGLFAWGERVAREVAAARGVRTTQLDSGAFAEDPRQQEWLAAAGYRKARSWLQMRRPVTPADAEPDAFGSDHPSLVVRRVRRAPDRMPEHDDLVTVHGVLEEAFTDHFNYRAETFDEFLARLREDPGHRWDHWWVAEVVEDGTTRPAGALVGSVLPGADGAPDGSYVSYLGVLRSARGRGAARSLLHAVIADAAARGRDRVSLEVDADSPTGAVGLYESEGFRTRYVTQSWHRDLPVADDGAA